MSFRMAALLASVVAPQGVTGTQLNYSDVRGLRARGINTFGHDFRVPVHRERHASDGRTNEERRADRKANRKRRMKLRKLRGWH